MTKASGLEAVPQILCELNQLKHVELEYSSTLHSYKIITKVLDLVKENVREQIDRRTRELKYYSTEQGIGLRKIMLEHYEKLHSTLLAEHTTLKEVTLNIFQKRKFMENSLNFIEPIVKEMQHKSKVLEKELNQVLEKITKLEEKKQQSMVLAPNIDWRFNEKDSAQILQTSEKVPEKQTTRKQPESPTNMSLFSLRKFDKLETEGQFDQVHQFLQLKLQEVQEFTRVEKKLAQKTVKKIFEIFDETLGKGLEKMEIQLLKCIKNNNISPSQSPPRPSQSSLQQFSPSSFNSTDLRCYQTIEQILQEHKQTQKMKQVKKRLYSSSQIDGVQLTVSIEQKNQQPEEIEVSPTFNFVYPLIMESGEEVNQFDVPIPKGSQEKSSIERSRTQNPVSYLYDSFSKENFNTINN